MIKNIVFDLGGVLIDYNPEKTVAEYFDPDTAAFLLRELFRSPLWRETDRGTLSAAGLCEKTIKGRVSDEVYSRALEMVENWGNYMPPFEDMTGIVERIKAAGMNVYLLSNIPMYFYKIADSIPALKYFDGFVISCELNIIKPEKGIFEALLGKYSLKAEECVFVDDMPENVEGAKRCGFSGIVFNHDDTSAFIENLRNLGISV